MKATLSPPLEWMDQPKKTAAPAAPRISRARARAPRRSAAHLMNTGVKQLIATAKENPWWTFTIEELAAITGFSRDAISAAKEHGARFPFGKSRPEWVMEWMAAHPRASLKNPLGE